MDSDPGTPYFESYRQTSDGSVPAAEMYADPKYDVGPPVASTEIALKYNLTPYPVYVSVGSDPIDFERLVLENMPKFPKDRVPIVVFRGYKPPIQHIDVLNDIEHEPGASYDVHEGHEVLVYGPHRSEPKIMYIQESRAVDFYRIFLKRLPIPEDRVHMRVYDHESGTQLDLSNTNARLPKTISVVVHPISDDGWLFDSDEDDDFMTFDDLKE